MPCLSPDCSNGASHQEQICGSCCRGAMVELSRETRPFLLTWLGSYRVTNQRAEVLTIMTEQAKTFQQVISGFSLKEIPFYLQWSGPAFTDVPADGDWGEGMRWICTIMIEDEDGDPIALGDMYRQVGALDSASFTPADGSPDEEQIYQDTEDRLLARFGMGREDAQHIDYAW